MIVVGGTYHESVEVGGYSEDLGGSAFRAARLLGQENALVTAVEPQMTEILAGACETLRLDLNNVGRDRAVGFHYLAPFVEPTLAGKGAALSAGLAVTGQSVLVFGIVEDGERRVSADMLVYDPQSVDDRSFEFLANVEVGRLAICANRSEIMALGCQPTLESSAIAVLNLTGAEVVVAKAGALGALIVSPGSIEWIGAVPSSTVRKVGTGDVFSATFAHAWTHGVPALGASRFASASTAAWANGDFDVLPSGALEVASAAGPLATEVRTGGRRPRIYLAAPFFTIAELWLVAQCRSFLIDAGADVFSPYHDVGLGGAGVAVLDLEGLASCDAVFAILDGWDAGTLFETGWSTLRGIPVVAVSSIPDGIASTMLVGTGAEVHSDFVTAMYRAIWRGLGVLGDSDLGQA